MLTDEMPKKADIKSKQKINLSTNKITRQQLLQLEQKKKTTFQKILDILIVLLPVLCSVISILEYQFIENSSLNRKPNTYLGFLFILIGMYLVNLFIGVFKFSRGDKNMFQKIRYKAPLYSVLFLLLALYDYLTLKTGILTQPFLPCLNSIINIAWEDRRQLIISALHTLQLLFMGYFIGVIAGLITGITCGYNNKIRYWVNPIIKFLGPIPTSTWIPIIMVISNSLFGGAIFIISLGVWFAVTVASMTGISNVDRDYFEVAKTLGASESQLVFKIAIPHAMPSILQGMTQGMSTACTAIMIAEMLGVKAGLGWYITWAKSWACYDKMFASLFIICLIFTLVTKTLNLIKKNVLRWQIGVVK
ncbi:MULTISPECIES: ABC transporter permease [unclassified Clostridium]|jgi:NitT/TauT family transport system permease protein|uniref:ABC transporter permease n=1 Tax=unclassified Clostridium TaxID=2614128 RepID=UPI003F8DB306